MERFVQLVLAGGLAMVVGLWLWALSQTAEPTWVAGVALALSGTAAVLYGIWGELER